MQDFSFVWNQYDMIRGMFLAGIAELSEEEVDIVPNGYKNNIRWNIGHILLIQDYMLFGPEGMKCPPYYGAMFAPGTSPADWKKDGPSLETFVAQLKEQHVRVKEELHSRLNEPLPKPFQLGDKGTIHTYGEMMIFTLFHEGMHIGYISSLKKGIALSK